VRIIPTSLSFATRPFGYWCGSLKYRFEVIASNFHRGRLAIIYDPNGNIGTADVFNTTFNTIIDLEDGRDFTMTFDWQDDKPWLATPSVLDMSFYTTIGPQTYTGNIFSNGVFYVQVVNELVVPDGVSDVQILVSIMAGDDFMVNNTTNQMANYSPYEPQSGVGSLNAFSSATEITPQKENSDESPTEENVTTSVRCDADSRLLVCFGERPTHLRQLLKRFCLHRLQANSASGNKRDVYLFKQMGISRGFSTQGVDQTTLAVPYNYVGMTYMDYFKLGYAAWRGSTRWKIIPTCKTINSLEFQRNASNISSAYTYRFVVSTGLASITVDEYARNGLEYAGSSMAGTAIATYSPNTNLEFEMPYYLNTKFSRTSPVIEGSGDNSLVYLYPAGDTGYLAVQSSSEGSVITGYTFETYTAAGEDFSLHGFTGAPVMYQYSNPSP